MAPASALVGKQRSKNAGVPPIPGRYTPLFSSDALRGPGTFLLSFFPRLAVTPIASEEMRHAAHQVQDLPLDGGAKALDQATMATIGKVQQVKREFGFWTILGLTASMMCTWEAVFFANGAAMLNGGPPTLIYGFIYAFAGALTTAASLGELASMYPTSGGQYHWTAMLAPPSQKAFLSWFCGWIATLGWVANTAAGAFFAATMIQGVLVQTSASYIYQRWHGTLLMFAVMIVVFLVNSISTKILSHIEGFVLVLHIGSFLAILVPLVYFSPHGSATEVFATFTNSAGWNNGLSWLIGFSLSANLPLIGYDGPAHLAEEVHHAARTVPWCMVLTVLLNGTMGFAIVIAFSFCIVPTFEDALTSPTGYDFIEVFYNATGSAGAAGLTAILIALVWCATFGFLATASRQTWAFARDKGLPFSQYFAHVDQTTSLPLRAIALCSVLPCLIGLINIGSTAAFNAIVSLTEAGLFISYLIPICLIMIKKVRREDIEYGPWKMSRWMSLAVNLFSIVFLTVSVFFSFWPPALPVTAVNMNWSIAVFGGFVILGLIWYSLFGRRQYDGPIFERTMLATSESKALQDCRH